MQPRGQTDENLPHPHTNLRYRIVRSASEAAAIRSTVLASAEQAAAWFRGFKGSPIELLTALRFDKLGYDPITGNPTNVVEQVNQTFTVLVSLRAVEQLIQMHPDANGFQLALGTCSGRDIQSVEPDLVSAEVFSATHPGSNQKLKKDIARLTPDKALHRYVFFAAPNYKPGRQPRLETEREIQVHCVEI